MNQKKKGETKKEIPTPETKTSPSPLPSTGTSITNTTHAKEQNTVMEEKTQQQMEWKEKKLHSSIQYVHSRGRGGGFNIETVLGGIPPSIQRPSYKQIVGSFNFIDY